MAAYFQTGTGGSAPRSSSTPASGPCPILGADDFVNPPTSLDFTRNGIIYYLHVTDGMLLYAVQDANNPYTCATTCARSCVVAQQHKLFLREEPWTWARACGGRQGERGAALRIEEGQ